MKPVSRKLLYTDFLILPDSDTASVTKAALAMSDRLAAGTRLFLTLSISISEILLRFFNRSMV